MLKDIFIGLGSGIIGFLGGFIIHKKIIDNKTIYAGSLHIDNSEKDEPEKIFLELYKDISNIKTGDSIVLYAIKENYISQNKQLL